MTRVDFYILSEPRREVRARFACRVVEKAYQRGYRIHLHAGSGDEARALDDLLWTWREDSFLPHRLLADGNGPEVIRIGHGAESWPAADVLVNLAPEVPAFFSGYPRVVEIVTQDPETTRLGREHYRFYRERGYPLNTHDLREKQP